MGSTADRTWPEVRIAPTLTQEEKWVSFVDLDGSRMKGPNNKDYGIWASILGPYFWETTIEKQAHASNSKKKMPN